MALSLSLSPCHEQEASGQAYLAGDGLDAFVLLDPLGGLIVVLCKLLSEVWAHVAVLLLHAVAADAFVSAGGYGANEVRGAGVQARALIFLATSSDSLGGMPGSRSRRTCCTNWVMLRPAIGTCLMAEPMT
jgi:hypothetical protein